MNLWRIQFHDVNEDWKVSIGRVRRRIADFIEVRGK